MKSIQVQPGHLPSPVAGLPNHPVLRDATVMRERSMISQLDSEMQSE